MAFPNQVNTYQAPAVAGDFASNNTNNFSLLAPPGGAFYSGPNGVTIGAFAWADQQSGIVNSYGTGLVSGFVPRHQNADITVFLAETSYVIAPGQGLALMNSGDFWVVNGGAAYVAPGQGGAVQKAYANYATGAITFGPTGTPPTGAGVTGSIASSTGTFTGSIAIPATPANAPGTLTVTAVASGVLSAGGTLTGLTSVIAGTTIVKQLTGTATGVGTYEVSVPQTVVSSTGTATNGLLTVTAVSTGSLSVGDVLTGSGVTAGTAITQLGNGTGGIGTYYVNDSQTVASETLTVYGGVETKWSLLSAGAPGELVMITSTVQG